MVFLFWFYVNCKQSYAHLNIVPRKYGFFENIYILSFKIGL